jgi:hypothetical protein
MHDTFWNGLFDVRWEGAQLGEEALRLVLRLRKSGVRGTDLPRLRARGYPLGKGPSRTRCYLDTGRGDGPCCLIGK